MRKPFKQPWVSPATDHTSAPAVAVSLSSAIPPAPQHSTAEITDITTETGELAASVDDCGEQVVGIPVGTCEPTNARTPTLSVAKPSSAIPPAPHRSAADTTDSTTTEAGALHLTKTKQYFYFSIF